jgi:Tfp pilus assembly protein PilX
MMAATMRSQRGAALVISLIMLTLITLLVITALNLGTANFRAVSNTQFRDEATAAANLAIMEVISSPFTDNPAAVATNPINVDLDQDGTNDYVVNIAVPLCIYAAQASSSDPSSVGLSPTLTAASTWNTVWDLNATVAPTSNAAEAAVRVRSGVRVLLNEAQKDVVCP